LMMMAILAAWALRNLVKQIENYTCAKSSNRQSLISRSLSFAHLSSGMTKSNRSA
jgi:hypothetical protein